MNGITAKMACLDEPAKENESERVQLNAVYAEEGVNKQWAQFTPAGHLSLTISPNTKSGSAPCSNLSWYGSTIDNPSAQGFFQKGKEYIVTIREAQPGE